MTHAFRGRIAALAILLGGGSTLLASPDEQDVFLKIRTGSTAGTVAQVNDHHMIYGLAVGTSLPMGWGKLDLELAFDAAAGRRRDATRFNGPVYYNPSNPTTSYNGQTLTLSPTNSLDTRKHSFSGFGVRVGTSAPLRFLEGWQWQAGLSLDRYSSRLETILTLVPMAGGTRVPALTTGGPTYYEGLAQTRSRSRFTPGAYVGLKRTLADAFLFEANIRALGFTQIDYAPFTYTGKTAAYSDSTKFGYTAEIGFGLKL